jgi:hypothetical protein
MFEKDVIFYSIYFILNSIRISLCRIILLLLDLIFLATTHSVDIFNDLNSVGLGFFEWLYQFFQCSLFTVLAFHLVHNIWHGKEGNDKVFTVGILIIKITIALP